jgi:hypothetical protein
MKAKISDITPLYLPQMIMENEKNNKIFWYRPTFGRIPPDLDLCSQFQTAGPPSKIDITTSSDTPIIEPTKDIVDIINKLNNSGFPEYISILNDAIVYFKNKILNDCDELNISKIICSLPDHGKCMINILVDDNCEMAKKHHGDEFGFIRLFSLALNYHKQKNGSDHVDIDDISLNAKLAVEYFAVRTAKIYGY